MVYDSTQLRAPPLTWSDLISNHVPYALAAGGGNSMVSDSFLAQYVALGGKFSDARGKPSLDRVPLRDTLEFYRTLISQTIVISNPLSIVSPDDAWRIYAVGGAALVDTSTGVYLRERTRLKNAAFGAVPTRDGNLASIARSWGYAVVAKDPARHAAAERFVEWMLSAENNAAWNRAFNRVPVRKSALPLWQSDGVYRDFVAQLLGAAANRPPSGLSNSLDAVLETALSDVLANGLSPSAAADKAIAALAR
ncbi:MAG: extracellular solute-binding protein [Chloroflexi bacterium]|nr:extracellular solute-binding protein [Chloroflexota bacterium]